MNEMPVSKNFELVPANFELVDQPEAAKRLGITTRTLQMWTRKHRLPVVRISRTTRYNWAELQKVINDRFTVR